MEKTHINFDKLLREKGIKPTAIRLKVLRNIIEEERVISLSILEERLPTMDKSTLFRTLTLFHRQHLIHSIDDGSGSLKYSICSNLCCEAHYEELHPHFYCQICGSVVCLKDNHIPKISLPEGYMLSNINFVIKGTCPKCHK